jgi:hypothetical protein
MAKADENCRIMRVCCIKGYTLATAPEKSRNLFSIEKKGDFLALKCKDYFYKDHTHRQAP